MIPALSLILLTFPTQYPEVIAPQQYILPTQEVRYEYYAGLNSHPWGTIEAQTSLGSNPTPPYFRWVELTDSPYIWIESIPQEGYVISRWTIDLNHRVRAYSEYSCQGKLLSYTKYDYNEYWHISSSHLYGPNNQPIMKIGWLWDEEGHLKARAGFGKNHQIFEERFAYNAQDQLIDYLFFLADNPESTFRWQMQYDLQGRLIRIFEVDPFAGGGKILGHYEYIYYDTSRRIESFKLMLGQNQEALVQKFSNTMRNLPEIGQNTNFNHLPTENQFRKELQRAMISGDFYQIEAWERLHYMKKQNYCRPMGNPFHPLVWEISQRLSSLGLIPTQVWMT